MLATPTRRAGSRLGSLPRAPIELNGWRGVQQEELLWAASALDPERVQRIPRRRPIRSSSTCRATWTSWSIAVKFLTEYQNAAYANAIAAWLKEFETQRPAHKNSGSRRTLLRQAPPYKDEYESRA